MFERLAVLLMLVVLPMVAFAGIEPQSQTVPSRLTLETDKASYSVAEPISLTFGLFNDTDDEARGPWDLRVSGRLRVYYRVNGGQPVHYRPDWLQWLQSGNSGCVEGREFVIEPGEHLSATSTLFYNGRVRRLVIAEPGEYEFYAVLGLNSTEPFQLLESNPVSVTVHKADDAKAADSLRDPMLAGFLEGDFTSNPRAIQNLEQGALKAKAFLASFGQDAMAPFVRHCLTLALFEAKSNRRLTPILEELLESDATLKEDVNTIPSGLVPITAGRPLLTTTPESDPPPKQ